VRYAGLEVNTKSIALHMQLEPKHDTQPLKRIEIQLVAFYSSNY
jgi:hypothetical protein